MSRLFSGFVTDLRALALFRIAIATIFVVDLFTRSAAGLEAFYADRGLLPRGPLLEEFSHPWNWSVLFLNGRTEFVALVFAIGVMSGTAMALGLYTRLATFVSWVVLVSIHSRNPMILHGGDVLLRQIFFWSLFAPLGARLSVDAKVSPPPETPNRYWSIATVALLAQVVVLYEFAFLHKTGKEWWPQGTAVQQAMQVDVFAWGLAHWIRPYPGLMKFLTYLTLVVQSVGPALLVSPVATPVTRTIALTFLVGMHVALGLSLDLGSFPWIDAASMITFLPVYALDRLQGWMDRFDRALDPIARWVRARVDGGRWHPPVIQLTTPWRTRAFVTGMMGYVFWWNVASLEKHQIPFPQNWTWLAHVTRTDQVWNMFSPRPMRDDGWYRMPGKLEDGTRVDVYHVRMGEPSMDEPEDRPADYVDQRWRKYLMNLWGKNNSAHRVHYGRWLCRHWSDVHPEAAKLARFQITYMKEQTRRDGTEAEVEPVEIWDHVCLSKAERQRKEAREASAESPRAEPTEEAPSEAPEPSPPAAEPSGSAEGRLSP